MPTEGELWARAALADLRRGSFGLRAWRQFVAASLRRAGETRRARRELARQARAWVATGAGASLIAPPLLASTGLRVPRVRAQLAWWVCVSAMLDWHLGMVESPDGRPRRLSAADALTLARLWLVPFALAAPPARRWSLGVLAAGGATDALDGALARAGRPTRLGHSLDKSADVAFTGAMAAAARREGWLGQGASGALAARHASVVALTALHYFLRGGPPSPHRFAEARAAGPFLFVGLAFAASGRQHIGDTLVAAGSTGALVWSGAGKRLGKSYRAIPI